MTSRHDKRALAVGDIDKHNPSMPDSGRFHQMAMYMNFRVGILTSMDAQIMM